jgi:hypothetical protein
MEDIKLVKITELNSIEKRTKEQPQNRWRDEAINDLRKLNREI